MIRLERMHREQMSAHASACLPEEACGLIGGARDGDTTTARVVLGVTNELHSAVRFRMDPMEQLHAFQTLENAGLELIGIFHSHPNGPPTPSASDLAEFLYPGVLTLILSPGEGGWTLRAFEMEAEAYREVPAAWAEED